MAFCPSAGGNTPSFSAASVGAYVSAVASAIADAAAQAIVDIFGSGDCESEGHVAALEVSTRAIHVSHGTGIQCVIKRSGVGGWLQENLHLTCDTYGAVPL